MTLVHDVMDDWYKDGIIYQTHVRAFFDSNDDGIGDFGGLTAKLDYIQDLGVNILWLLPFYPSPLKDDGYDIANYTAVNASYGSLSDFKAFVREAHARGIRVVTELVINHTSDQHAWFQKSRRAKPGSPWRDYYVWSDTPERYRDARIIFKDFESSNWAWDPVAKAYYWHRFFSHQPDLNFDNPAVHEALFKVLEFWMNTGVDAFRLDAIPYLYEREGTTCENLPETHVFLRKLRAHMDEKFPGRMLLAEANQWPEDTLPYFGDGDECHMAFHFPVMPRMYMSLAMEDRFPVIDIMSQTPPIPENCQWAMFLRNHDELTLEMVTEEDRDYMWRTYAKDTQARINLGIRRRLAPLLENHRGRIHLMNGLLMSFPGTPVIYYGDELGMGDNIYLGDRNGVRTPMQWSADRNAGFSRCNPQRLFLPVIIDPAYHYEQVNVEQQQSSQYSLLWWMKRLIAMRKRYRSLGRGTIEFLHPENRKILAYVRRLDDEIILVVANLSRHVQCFEVDLSMFRGMQPVELSGATRFPVIGDKPYFLNLSPFAFYWFSLERARVEEVAKGEELLIVNAKSWEEALTARHRGEVERAIMKYLRTRRWFGGKARAIANVTLREVIKLNGETRLALVDVEFAEGEAQLYQIPLAIAHARRSGEQETSRPNAIARLRDGAQLYEPIQDAAFAEMLLDAIGRRKTAKGPRGSISGTPTRDFRELRGEEALESHVLAAEQSNTAITYGQRLFLKLFRKLEPGVNSDLEVTRFLNEETSFAATPRIAGALEYRATAAAEPITLAILQSYTANSGDAWKYTLDAIGRYFDDLLSDPSKAERIAREMPSSDVLELAQHPPSDLARETIGAYIADAETLGTRTAQMHLALASRSDIPAFAPQPFTPHYQRSIYQSLRTQIVQTIQLARKRSEAAALVPHEKQMLESIREVIGHKITGSRIRIHGDYHLGQVLHTGADFVIIDFEGEPARPMSERRIKRSAMRDVAGMLRSFHYAPYVVVHGTTPGSYVRTEDVALLETGARFWQRWVSAAFLRAHLAESRQGTHLPSTREEIAVLLRIDLLQKALYEVAYELNHRPEWTRIPVQGVLELLG